MTFEVGESFDDGRRRSRSVLEVDQRGEGGDRGHGEEQEGRYCRREKQRLAPGSALLLMLGLGDRVGDREQLGVVSEHLDQLGVGEDVDLAASHGSTPCC